MKKLLCYAGTVMYSLLTGYLIWLLFFYITKWTMTFDWTSVIISAILGFMFLFVEIAFITSLISFPLIYLCGFINRAKWIPIIVLILLGLATAAFPWTVADWNVTPNIFMAAILSISAILIYAAYISVIFGMNDTGEDKEPEENFL